MIKNLIAQLTTGRVSLSSALKQSKVVVSYTSDEELKSFIELELMGYENQNANLPEYRRVFSQPMGVYWNKFNGETRTQPFDIFRADRDLTTSQHNRKILSSIPVIEGLIAEIEGGLEITQPYTSEQLQQQRETSKNGGFIIESAYWPIPKTALVNVLSRTQDLLIDILLRILKENPNLETQLDYMNDNEDNGNKTYHTNFHGNVIGSNLGVGETVVQKGITINNSPDVEALLTKIVELGFKREDTTELVALIEEQNKTGNSTLGKIMVWLGEMSTKAIELGIENQIPQLIPAVTTYVHTHPIPL